MTEPITRAEHEEYVKRMEEEHKRINKRLSILEGQNETIMEIAISVEKIALSVKQITETLVSQGARLEKLEARDGEKWRKITSYAATTALGILIGYIFKQLGVF